jgi:histidine triad (HIT) family protein
MSNSFRRRQLVVKDPNCIFCKIAAGEIPAKPVASGDDFVAIADINPQAPHHLLVLPRKHIANVTEFEDATELGRMFQAASEVAKQMKLTGNGFRLVVNTGSDGGQTVDHFHIHVLAGRPMGWPPG